MTHNNENSASQREGQTSAIRRLGDKRDVAAMALVSTRTVDTLLTEGLPHIKMGYRTLRFDLEEVRAWLRDRYHVQRRGGVKGGAL